MIAALSLRLVMTNGTRWALVGFIIAVIVLAAVTGFIWTGKTWCNYICPVGMVEKIYTEPIRLVERQELAVQAVHGVQEELSRHRSRAGVLEGDRSGVAADWRTTRGRGWCSRSICISIWCGGSWAYYFDGHLDARGRPDVVRGSSRGCSFFEQGADRRGGAADAARGGRR